jgi:hypothetical protein
MACPRPRWFRWWLFPATSIVHFGDELFVGGGFYTWVTSIGGVRVTMARFAFATVVAFVSITIASWVARRRYDWVLFALSAIIPTNALTHFIGQPGNTFLLARYCLWITYLAAARRRDPLSGIRPKLRHHLVYRFGGGHRDEHRRLAARDELGGMP